MLPRLVHLCSLWGGVLGTQVISKCFSQAFARGHTTAPSRLYARLCHAFQVTRTITVTQQLLMACMSTIYYYICFPCKSWIFSHKFMFVDRCEDSDILPRASISFTISTTPWSKEAENVATALCRETLH